MRLRFILVVGGCLLLLGCGDDGPGANDNVNHNNAVCGNGLAEGPRRFTAKLSCAANGRFEPIEERGREGREHDQDRRADAD